MMGTRSWIVVGVVVFAACQSSAPQPVEQRHAHAAPPPTSCKPEAPIAIDIATRAVGGDLEVTARVTPTRDVPLIELVLALPSHASALDATTTRFGASAAGVAQVMTTRIRADQRTSSITAIARVPVDDIVMARTATVEIGAPAPIPRTRTYALPDGELAREVRP